MTSLTTLHQILPVSSALVSAGSQTGCGGIAMAQIDLEAAPAYEFVDTTPDRYEDQNRQAGRYVVRQVLRESGLDDVPSPDGDYRVIRPRPSGSSSGTT